jgi:hypothetical protein
MQRGPGTTQVVVTKTSALTRRRAPRRIAGSLRGDSDITTLGFWPGRLAIGIVETRSELFPVVAAWTRCREEGLDAGSPAAGTAQRKSTSEPQSPAHTRCPGAGPRRRIILRSVLL